MRVQILYGFRGVETREQYLAAGEHELESGLASVLIGMGQAIGLDPATSSEDTTIETLVELSHDVPITVTTVKPTASQVRKRK